MRKNWMEIGRSMVEMLGVLAIIGVLSIVGLSSYRKAMLRHYANEAWDSMMKFQAVVAERAVLNPTEGCNNWYCSGLKDAPGVLSNKAYCFMDLKDLLPSFANGSYENYYNFFSSAKVEDKVAQWRNLPIDGLCRTLLPNGTLKGSGTSQYLSQSIDGIEYRCFRKNEDVAW